MAYLNFNTMAPSRNVHRATKTLEAIDEAIESDQGNAFRANLERVIPHIGDAYRSENHGFRSHMGASMLGDECARKIWYSFRWFTKSKFPGRILRLFNRGHLEEARFIAMLLTIGCDVFQQDANGNQFRVSYAGGHVGGSSDGLVSNVPDTPLIPFLVAEFKTSNEKNFNKLEQEGVRETHFTHFVQMNIYGLLMQVPAALYMSVDKNSDNVHAEIVTVEEEVGTQYLERGAKLVEMRDPPKRLSESPGFWKCRFCDHRGVCFNFSKAERNCRTCLFSRPVDDGTWYCERHNVTLDKEQQLKACDDGYEAIK